VYLGFLICSNELKMDPENFRDIREWPSPRSVFEVIMFHGLESFIEISLGISTVFVDPYLIL
jgi:hypothetical protein